MNDTLPTIPVPYNGTCAATTTIDLFDGGFLLDHIVCTAPYSPGPVGDNITDILQLCCNSTVELVHEDTPGRCIFYCNATRFDREADKGFVYWDAQHCVEINGPMGPNGSWNPYQIKCYPKGWGNETRHNSSASALSGPLPAGSPKLGLSLLVMVVFGMVLM